MRRDEGMLVPWWLRLIIQSSVQKGQRGLIIQRTRWIAKVKRNHNDDLARDMYIEIMKRLFRERNWLYIQPEKASTHSLHYYKVITQHSVESGRRCICIMLLVRRDL